MHKIKKESRSTSAQAVMEYVFCLIAIAILSYGMAKIFYWVGNDLSGRHIYHQETLIYGPSYAWETFGEPLGEDGLPQRSRDGIRRYAPNVVQLDTFFYKVKQMNATYKNPLSGTVWDRRTWYATEPIPNATEE